MCEKVVAAVFVVEPSPKSQNRLVMYPVEESINIVDSGVWPTVELAVKLAAGVSSRAVKSRTR